MAVSAGEHQVAGLVNRCYAGLDVVGLREDVLGRLRHMMPVGAAFFATLDPATLLFTTAMCTEPRLGAAAPLFLDNEFGREDVNKFAALAQSADHVSSLDRATRGDRAASARHREILAPLGLGGDELRAALSTGKACWGVLGLHREEAAHGFDDHELALVQRIAPHVAEGLRRAVTRGPAGQPVEREAGAPGIIVLDADLAVVSMSQEAGRWLAEIDDWPSTTELPAPVYAAAARLARREQAPPAPQPAPTVRLQSRSGRWLTLHATRLRGAPAPEIGVVIEPTPAAQVGSLLLSAYGLTDAQTRVAALALRGHSTREIVQELHISANTVQDHLTAVFDKLGVRSRRELVSTVLSGPS